VVHKGASAMRATFEFSHGGTEYRLTRQIRLGTRPRAGTSTVTQECSMEWLRPDGEWVELPDSLTKNGLEAAVGRLGFGFEPFTASVLLVQGQRDRLVLAGGKERFAILSGIFDLRHYERLESRARERFRTCKVEQQQLLATLEAVCRDTLIAAPTGLGRTQLLEMLLSRARSVGLRSSRTTASTM